MKSTDPAPVRRVMACVDFNDLDPPKQDASRWLNRMVLEMAGSTAFHERGQLDVVHVWHAIGEDFMRTRGRSGAVMDEVDSYVEEVRLKHHQWLERLLREARDWLGPETYDAVSPDVHMPKGMAGDVIPTLARELGVDLIVMGTVARTGIPGLIIGNTAERVLSEIDCSVMAVKPPGFVTPVTLQE